MHFNTEERKSFWNLSHAVDKSTWSEGEGDGAQNLLFCKPLLKQHVIEKTAYDDCSSQNIIKVMHSGNIIW